jgi:ribonuclease J
MEICTIGGYEEVGKNMTAVKIGEDVFVFDMGTHIPSLIELQEQGNQKTYSVKKLRSVGALPDDSVLDKLGWRDKVRAIVISHAHLDHVGGVPYIAQRYPQAEILATPFTMAVLDKILEDEKIGLSNKRKTLSEDSFYKIKGKSETYTLEFIHATHSTIQCAFLVLHTKEGVFFYALDFKFDNHPVIGKLPNYKRLREIGKKGVKVLVVDALYSGAERRTPSERIARNLLEDAFSNVRGKKSAFFISTFSSHIARLKSIVDFGTKTNRKILFIGRSLNKYINAAIKVNQCPFKNKIKLVSYKNQVNSMLKKVEQERGKYLVVCTGHQAEPDSMLDKIVQGDTPFKFKEGDNLIFSSSVIPTPVNISARERMDKRLKKIGVRIQTDVHVSGHGGREDLRDLIDILKPEHIIPAHGPTHKLIPTVELAREIGYSVGKVCHVMQNGQKIEV